MNKLCKILGLAGIVSASCVGTESKSAVTEESKPIKTESKLAVKPYDLEWTFTEQDCLLLGHKITRVTKYRGSSSSAYIISSAIYDAEYNLINAIGDISNVKPKYEPFGGSSGVIM